MALPGRLLINYEHQDSDAMGDFRGRYGAYRGRLQHGACQRIARGQQTAPDGTITLTFADGEQRPVDTTFTNLAEQLSGGQPKMGTVYYNAYSTSADVSIASAYSLESLISATSDRVPGRTWGSRRPGFTRSHSW